MRFTRQRCLGDAQMCAIGQAQVGRHDIARLQQHDIARHHLVGWQTSDFTATPHPRGRGGHAAQGGDGALGAGFLEETDGGIERHDDDDGQRVLEFAESHGNASRDEQHQNHDVGELGEKDAQRAALFPLRQGVGAVAYQPTGGFGSAQTGRGRHLQGRGYGLGSQGVPGTNVRGTVCRVLFLLLAHVGFIDRIRACRASGRFPPCLACDRRLSPRPPRPVPAC